MKEQPHDNIISGNNKSILSDSLLLRGLVLYRVCEGAYLSIVLSIV